jgi:hypothetical protein
MSILDHLASAIGRNDEQPNITVAEDLASQPNPEAVAELVNALTNAPKPVRSDAIKALYELGARDPGQIAPHLDALIALLSTKDNRLLWGALEAVSRIAPVRPDAVMAVLPQVLAAADRGSVIAKDNCIATLAALAAAGKPVLDIALDRLQSAAPNQFPMYAELLAPVIDATHLARFRSILEARLSIVDQPAKRGRIEKILRRMPR